MDETGCRGVDSGGRIGLPGRLVSEALSLAGLMGPLRRSSGPKAIGRRVLLPGSACQAGRHGGRRRMRVPAKNITLCPLAPAGVVAVRAGDVGHILQVDGNYRVGAP